MKLNPNCIRDILITVEQHSDFYHQTHYKKELPFSTLSRYSHEEILYHINQCKLSNLINDVHYYDAGNHIDIRDLTPEGHEFLANIRNNTVWKEIFSKVGEASLPIIIESAKQLALKHFLG